ncbi:MAG: hypothetical protein ACOC1M_02915 [Halanaerobium sp.]
MRNLYDFKKTYSLFSDSIKVVVLVFIFTFIIFSLIFDLQLNKFSSAVKKINPFTQAEEYRIKDINFADSSYQNGYLEFSAADLKENDAIVLREENDAQKNDAVMISNQRIYKIVEGELLIIGFIDSNFNGKNGRKLRINFFNELPDCSFAASELNDEQIPAWTAVNKELKLTEDKIDDLKNAELKTNLNKKHNNLDDNFNLRQNGNFKTEITANKSDSNDYALRLSLDNINAKKSHTAVHGPYIFSNNELYLSRGDKLSFDWKAESGTDSYSFCGYLFDQNGNLIQPIIAETGRDEADHSGWKQEKVEVLDSGRYRIVFAAGSYDFTGGRAVGAELYIDNIKVEEKNKISPVTAKDLNNIAKKVVFKKSGNFLSPAHQVNIRVKNNEGAEAVEKIVFNSAKDKLVFAEGKEDRNAAEQAKNKSAGPAANFTLQKYNEQDPERVDKLIIRDKSEQQAESDQSLKAEAGQNFAAAVYRDHNKNGIIDPGETKVADAVQITFKAESISRDENGNYQLSINPQSKTGTALNIVLDLNNLNLNESNRVESSQNYIIEIKK